MAFNSLKNVLVFNRPDFFEASTPTGSSVVRMIMIPFQRDIRDMHKSIHDMKALPDRRHILFAHCYIDELTMKHFGKRGDTSARDLEKSVDMAILGHHHVHDIITTSTPVSDPEITSKRQIVSVGSTLQHNFNDIGSERGFIVVDLGLMTVEHIPILGIPKFIDITASELANPKVEGKLKGNFVRVKANGKEQSKSVHSKMPIFNPAGYIVELVPAKEEARIKELASTTNDKELLEKFVTSAWSKTDHLSTERLLGVGRKYLERRPE